MNATSIARKKTGLKILAQLIVAVAVMLNASANASVKESQDHHVYKTLATLGFNGRCFTAHFDRGMFLKMSLERVTTTGTDVLTEIATSKPQEDLILWAGLYRLPDQNFVISQKDYPVQASRQQIIFTADYTTAGWTIDVDPKNLLRQSFITLSQLESAMQDKKSAVILELKSERNAFHAQQSLLLIYRVIAEFADTPFPK